MLLISFQLSQEPDKFSSSLPYWSKLVVIIYHMHYCNRFLIVLPVSAYQFSSIVSTCSFSTEPEWTWTKKSDLGFLLPWMIRWFAILFGKRIKYLTMTNKLSPCTKKDNTGIFVSYYLSISHSLPNTNFHILSRKRLAYYLQPWTGHSLSLGQFLSRCSCATSLVFYLTWNF